MRVLKKGASGAATNYISRRAALRKLQISLKDFRRLCILKGIYPHEPKSSKKVNKGSTANKTWYYAKDVHFLAHEPIIGKFRQYKIFLRKFKKAKDKREKETQERLTTNKPVYKLDRIVRERYPSVVEAIRDLDDALCMLFLFARMPTNAKVKSKTVQLCRRLSTEFLHFVIESGSLRKTFISIKGLYYQADVLGQTVTWVVPHQRGQPPPSDVDFAVMATFLEFYTTLMGFINYSLFTAKGLFYPPKVAWESSGSDSASTELVASLGRPLARSAAAPTEEAAPDEFEDPSGMDERRSLEAGRVKRLPKLFSGLKVFLNREVPAEALVFLVRACGGTVSWEGEGAVFPGTDAGITHHVIDRPKTGTQEISRIYVQPQWVFDSVNAGERLPEADYFPGAILPPHLSPFVEEKLGDYVPPERLAQLRRQGLEVDELEDALEKSVAAREPKEPAKKRAKRPAEEEPDAEAAVVREGRVEAAEHPQKALNRAGEETKLRESMIPKRRRRVYQKIKQGTKRHAREAAQLSKKRKVAENS